ncbi:MAG TPA: hypothetical protein VFR84_13315 [Candidatus Angelobacter sp.]|nr:hypothetical protein [Candidatus Angelobacter sp.]
MGKEGRAQEFFWMYNHASDYGAIGEDGLGLLATAIQAAEVTLARLQAELDIRLQSATSPNLAAVTIVSLQTLP